MASVIRQLPAALEIVIVARLETVPTGWNVGLLLASIVTPSHEPLVSGRQLFRTLSNSSMTYPVGLNLTRKGCPSKTALWRGQFNPGRAFHGALLRRGLCAGAPEQV